jgi:F-type H+-transporting ATPase subunit epsilon
VEGEIGILPGHIPLLTQVADGELRITKNGRTDTLVIGDGFAEVNADKVSILAENAIEEAKIDEGTVEAAMQRAQEALRGAKDLDPAEVERLEGVVRFAVAQLGTKRRRR